MQVSRLDLLARTRPKIAYPIDPAPITTITFVKPSVLAPPLHCAKAWYGGVDGGTLKLRPAATPNQPVKL